MPPTNYFVSDDPKRLDINFIYEFLTESYWARGVTFEKVKKSVENSLAFGVYFEGKQIGFARVVTDFARIAYIADVFILEEYRGQGLSKQLMQAILSHEKLLEIKKWFLMTSDAHGLYEQFGFRTTPHPEMYMEFIQQPSSN